MTKPLMTDKWCREVILDAYLQPLLERITKKTYHKDIYGLVTTRLTIEWIEKDD